VSKIVTDYILVILCRYITPGSEMLGVLHIFNLTFDKLVLRSNIASIEWLMSDCDINGKARLQGFIVIIADKVSKIVTDYILGILYR